MSKFRFRRYVRGVEMAEGVTITQADNLADAITRAVALAPKADNTTLVYEPDSDEIKRLRAESNDLRVQVGEEHRVRIAVSDTNERLRAENARLREALGPFAQAAAKADKAREEHQKLGMGRLSDNAICGYNSFGELFAARKALEAKE